MREKDGLIRSPIFDATPYRTDDAYHRFFINLSDPVTVRFEAGETLASMPGTCVFVPSGEACMLAGPEDGWGLRLLQFYPRLEEDACYRSRFVIGLSRPYGACWHWLNKALMEPCAAHFAACYSLIPAWRLLLDSGLGLPPVSQPFMVRAVEIVHRELVDISASGLAGRLGISRAALRHRFKRHTGMTTEAYIKRARMNEVVKRILEGEDVTHACAEFGVDMSWFSRELKSLTGVNPRAVKSARMHPIAPESSLFSSESSK